MDELVQFAVKFAGAVAEAEKAGPENYSALLSKTIPGLVAEAFTAFPEIKKEIAGMGESQKTAFTSALKERVLQTVNNKKLAELVFNIVCRLVVTADEVLEITLMVIGIMSIIPDYLINSLYSLTKQDITVSNPPEEYWFQRVDGKGEHHFFAKDELYLVISIPPTPPVPQGSTPPHYNSEIYNSPYTAMLPKNVTINTFPVDPPSEQANFIDDFFINAPYAPLNGAVFSARIKAENLKGGSRGWGFWNTSLISGQYAWFIQLEGYEGEQSKWNGFWAQTRNASGEIWPPSSNIRLPDLDEEWHDYRIELHADSVKYFIDEKLVATVTDPASLPDTPMAFHNWVDNELYLAAPPYMVFLETSAPRVNKMQNMMIELGKTETHYVSDEANS
jgi:hypothetical protein